MCVLRINLASSVKPAKHLFLTLHRYDRSSNYPFAVEGRETSSVTAEKAKATKKFVKGIVLHHSFQTFHS